MLTAFIFVAIVVLFLPFILLYGRISEDDRRMRERFALLHIGGAGGLSSTNTIALLKSNKDLSSGWVEHRLASLSNLLQLEPLLLRAGSAHTARALLGFCASGGFGTGILLLILVRSLSLALIVGFAAGVAPVLVLRRRATRHTAAMNKVLPGVLDMISRALRAGHSLPAAIGIVAEEAAEPARSAFGDVFQKQKFGLPIRDALLDLVRRFPSDDLRVLVTAILVQRDTGGNLVQILDRTSSVIRERLKLQGDVRVHTAQGRMTGWILCSLPVLMLGMLTLSNPDYPSVLIKDPLGRKLLYGGGILLCVGGFLINRIVNQIEV